MTDNLRRVRIFDGRKLQRLVMPVDHTVETHTELIAPNPYGVTTSTNAYTASYVHTTLRVLDANKQVVAMMQGITAYRDESIEIEEAEWDGKMLNWKSVEQ